MTSALAGIRVLDLGDRSAALAGRILADLGAEVVLVEPSDGNPIRRTGPTIAPGETAAHHYFSANKRSVVHDDATWPALVASADVVIDNGQLDNDQLLELRPGLVHCSVTPFGLDGEWSDWKGPDLIACSAGGLVWLSGEPRGRPVQGGSEVSFAMAGLIAASGVSIALHGGRGAHLDISLQEAALMAAMQTATPSHWAWHGRIPRRPGLSQALRCADGGYVGHLIRPDRFDDFLAWAERVGIDHGMTSDDWAWARLDAPRKDNPVAATTLALAATLGRDEFAAGAIEADLVCLPVLGFDDLEHTEQYVTNGQFFDVHHPGLDQDLGFVRSPVDGMPTPATIRPAPALGQDQALLDGLVSAPPERTSPPLDPASALAGLRVVDFTWVLAGPLGTRILASFGAEVIRIESATKPDSMRSQIGPDGVPDPDLGGLHNSVNVGKKSVAVDLTDPRGMAIAKELIATADVVVNNFRPGAMERMGLGHEVLRALKPDIISVNVPGAHRAGPWSDRPTMGNILMAASGFNMLTGFPGDRPRGIGVAYPDFTAPHLTVTMVMAALRERARTGEDQELHVTQLSGMVSLLGAEWLHYKATGVVPQRRANRDVDHCPHGVFRAAASEHSDDEWVAIAVASESEWAALASEIGGGLETDHRFASHALRKQNEDDLDALLEAWTATQDKWDVAVRLQALGVAAAPVEHLADTFERDPQLRHHYQTVHQPIRPDLDVPVDREPARWVGCDHVLRRSPSVGEHNQHVICDVLGHAEDEYVELLLGDVLR